MGEELEKNIGVAIELIAGTGGIFDVFIDNREIFSKSKQGRFPEPAEIIAAMKKKP